MSLNITKHVNAILMKTSTVWTIVLEQKKRWITSNKYSAT